ncbi:MAG: hypothetical protein HYU36_04825 [Planctomycetes bacterium]|nr:hypothetical protein [Planctomycetota bacterium]
MSFSGYQPIPLLLELFLFVACSAGLAETPVARLDGRGNLLIDGRPVFPLELYGVRTEEDFAIARAHGFNAVIEFGDAIEARAERHGLLLTDPNWFHRDHPDSKVWEEVQRHRGQPALFAYNLSDEPDLRPESGCSPGDLARFARLLRRDDPARLLSVTCSGGAGGVKLWKEYAALVDIFRIDPYPVVAGAPLLKLAERLEHAKEAAGPRKPVWTVLQAWTLGPGNGFPTESQDRCMTYLALAGGASGVSHFDFNVEVWSQFPDFWNGLIRNNREMRLLSPVLLEGNPVQAESDSPHVRTAAWRRKGILLALVVNGSDASVETVLKLSGLSGRGNLRPRRLFPERQHGTAISAPEFLPEATFPEGPWVSAACRLEAREVMVLEFPRSGWTRSLDADGLSDADVRGEGVACLDRRGRSWLRLKNVSESPSPASVYWPRAGGPEVRELDIAFRPLRRVFFERQGERLVFDTKPQTAYEIGNRPLDLDFDGDARTFERLGLDLEFDSPYPAEGGFRVPACRYRAFTGALLPVRVRWSSQRPVDAETLRIEVVEPEWRARLLRHETNGSGCNGVFHFEIQAGRPARPDRDEVLTLLIRRNRHQIRRAIRFRFDDPLECRFEWKADETGLVSGHGSLTLESRFPGYAFPDLGVRLLDAPEGWSIRIGPGIEPLHFEVEASPPDSGPGEGRVHHVRLAAALPAANDQPIPLPRLLLAGGRLYEATDRPRRVRVTAMAASASPVRVDGVLADLAWSQAAALQGFLGLGTVEFADRQSRAWFCRDAEALYFAAEIPAETGVTARARMPDQLDPADDIVELYLDSDTNPGFRALFVNPNGALADFSILPGGDGEGVTDLSWSSHAEVGVCRTEKAWSLELRLPFAAMPGGTPSDGAAWRFNVRLPHGVAPRVAEIYSFCSGWQPGPDEMAFLEY